MSTKQELMIAAAKAITAGLSSPNYPGMDFVRYENSMSSLKDYSEPTLQSIISATHMNRYLCVDTIIGSSESNETYLADFLNVAGCLEDHGYIDLEHVESRVASFRHYGALCPMGENGEYPELRKTQCEALITITSHIERVMDSGIDEYDDYLDYSRGMMEEGLVPVLVNDGLCELVFGGKHSPTLVARIMVERNIMDPEDIKELLESAHPAVIEGVL